MGAGVEFDSGFGLKSPELAHLGLHGVQLGNDPSLLRHWRNRHHKRFGIAAADADVAGRCPSQTLDLIAHHPRAECIYQKVRHHFCRVGAKADPWYSAADNRPASAPCGRSPCPPARSGIGLGCGAVHRAVPRRCGEAERSSTIVCRACPGAVIMRWNHVFAMNARSQDRRQKPLYAAEARQDFFMPPRSDPLLDRPANRDGLAWLG